ncbi:2-amino-4-hydroxy-6-hydroxymethyldihydropteridine diphosphokinase [Qipengyuania aquimaris]|uniref:2-amino-4-hydroxy-6- hydroxymethyldihydropteridine diphosphokinase n=1 Tax=Qipengyuania aquimaris TaxID=255984 RepID=UPI001CD227AE|nr:2-amino-4-hydroxy-6-hydroxymethyldihydropteridine diphosphokinase [Qipengyuania aquimaris]MCA0903031.1 2-amino-4-hydroxy-6-hydroxymethyldihydropteridine diphosphokinase [Qipengyuania aquimaris]
MRSSEMEGGVHRYLIALGSNMRVPGVGGPRRVLGKVRSDFERRGLVVEGFSPLLRSRPIGPSQREYANGAAIVASQERPREMLDLLQEIEREYGRRRTGAPWRRRQLDLDIILWSGGEWSSPDLAIPHPLFRGRGFVLQPAAAIAPDWRDPVTGLTVRQLAARAS